MEKISKFIPADVASAEYEIQKSRFIASASPAFTVEEARSFIYKMKKEYSDATHNVSAFAVMENNSLSCGSSDDGEPSGTAGKPVLSVISSSIFNDIVIVVTRYFGGIKLGTGGLARAYSESARRAVDILPRAIIRTVSILDVMLPYSYYEPVLALCEKSGANIVASDFSDKVKITVKIADDIYDNFSRSMSDVTNGNAACTLKEHGKSDIVKMP